MIVRPLAWVFSFVAIIVIAIGQTNAAETPEDIFWKSVKRNNDPVEYRLYIKQFPQGKYVHEARQQVGQTHEPAQQNIASNVSAGKGVQKSQVLTDGFKTGRKIHLVGGKNPGKPYVGFILNRVTKSEDEFVLNGDFASAIELYQELESRGDTAAAHNLGLMYVRGLGVQKNVRLGMSYLEKSMEDLSNFNTSNTYFRKAEKELLRKPANINGASLTSDEIDAAFGHLWRK